jgi:hypothetical protein
MPSRSAPCGSSGVPQGARRVPLVYLIHALVRNSAHPFLTLKRIEDTVVVDLRNGSATDVDLLN